MLVNFFFRSIYQKLILNNIFSINVRETVSILSGNNSGPVDISRNSKQPPCQLTSSRYCSWRTVYTRISLKYSFLQCSIPIVIQNFQLHFQLKAILLTDHNTLMHCHIMLFYLLYFCSGTERQQVFSQKGPSQMFDRVLNTPFSCLQSSQKQSDTRSFQPSATLGFL